MDSTTRKKLNAVNEAFYAAQAEAFDASRNHPWPGWQRAVLPLDPTRGDARLRILDVGCGNGRFVDFLLREADGGEGGSRALDYLGVDQSRALLAIASQAHPSSEPNAVRWLEGDVLAEHPDSPLPPGPFDLIVAFGLLHHVPALEQRMGLLGALAKRIAGGGQLVFTTWRFGAVERFERHVVPWERYNAESTDPVSIDELEAGDYLLSFGAKTGPPRYCHYSDDAEFDRLVAATGLELRDDFEADGSSGDLNRYACFDGPDDT